MSANSQALAGGIAALALYDLLLEKGLISKDEARTALQTARDNVLRFSLRNTDVVSAAQVLAVIVKGLSE